MHRGYIKLWRRLKDSDIWLKDKFTRGQAWVDLLMLANYKEGYIRKRGIRIDLKRGEMGWSEQELADRWKWSRGKVRRFLSELCSENESKLVQQTIPQKKFVTSCYKITNYNIYQDHDTANSTANGQQTDSKRYRKKKDKKEKKDKNINNTIPYGDIIAYLNSKSGKNFNPKTKATKSHIKARWNEGFRLDDFHRVINTKCDKWLTDDKMVDFIRPQTLFGTKFESYLNESVETNDGLYNYKRAT